MRRTTVKPPPGWVKDGARVLFESVRGMKEYTYSSVVDGEPFQLGDGTWCVRLREMVPHYPCTRPRLRPTESAACVDFIRPNDAPGAAERSFFTTERESRR